jgi:hypothetical protein
MRIAHIVAKRRVYGHSEMEKAATNSKIHGCSDAGMWMFWLFWQFWMFWILFEYMLTFDDGYSSNVEGQWWG